MGRRKLKIRRLESMKARQTKYSKRKIGILKKARELAVLCDTDLALLMFSPTGKPSLCVGQNKDLSTVLERLAKMSVDDREERRGYTMKLQQDQLRELKDKLAEKTKILRGNWYRSSSNKGMKPLIRQLVTRRDREHSFRVMNLLIKQLDVSSIFGQD
ncbi:hypothetical protein KPL71_002300 [Citrus sinensis]|uniref:Uncharacterized protein n=1 Tax=Citrus sinensis TaxID=2711 RepID=A0ACB8P4H0_CITSI|nr:hypothetical protein KPL71_002300 [Citrus sinensis]